MNKRSLILSSLLTLLILSGIAYLVARLQSVYPTVMDSGALVGESTSAPAPVLDPLEINAIKARTYPGNDYQLSLNQVAFLQNLVAFYKINL